MEPTADEMKIARLETDLEAVKGERRKLLPTNPLYAQLTNEITETLRRLNLLMEQKAPVTAPAAAAAAVLVSDWQSLTMKRVPYKQGMTLEAFRINVSIEFGKAQKILKLYHVPERNEAQWTDPMKRKVAKENFDNVIAEALSLADEATYPIIYAHFDNSSPTSSPGHLLAAETTSIKSAGSSGSRSRTDQQNFRSVLLERDGNMCRICCATQAIEAAHIIEWSAKLNTVTLYKDYHISGKFDYRNGLMLCSECHDQYDSYEIGILPTGDVIPKTGTKNEETRNIFTTARQDNFDQPTELVLGYKYKKFVAKHISTPKRKGIFKKLTSLSLGT